MSKKSLMIWLFAAAAIWLSSCAESSDAEDDDTDTGTDSDTDTDSDSDSDTDSDSDSDSDSDTDSDTDSDSDSDSDTDTDSDTGAPDGGVDCEDPLVVPEDENPYEFSSNWMYFQDDTFDSYQTGCSGSDGTTAWFEVDVPAGYTLEVEKTSGATVGVNIVENCDSTSCLVSDTNRAVWPNLADTEVTWMVAIETDFSISAAAMDFTFDRYEKHGETCIDGIPMEGPYPQTEETDANDYDLDTMPSGCGSSYSTYADIWYRIPIPPATQMTFTAQSTSWGWYYGYSLDCESCELNQYVYSPDSFIYTNTTAETLEVYAFIQDDEGWDDWKMLGGTYTATVDMEPLPDGDACVGAIDIDETALPYTWSDSSPLFIHSCPSGICPGTTGPDVWHEITVPAGDVVRVDKTAGPAAFFAAVAQCTDTSGLFFSTDPELLVWQNITAEPQTIYIVAGAVSASSIATLELEFDIETPAAGDFCGSAIPVAYNDTAAKTGDWADFGDYFWGAPGCGAANGAEVWYEVEVPSGEKLTITETSPSDTTIQVLAACDAGECVESNTSEVAIYLNTTTSDHSVFVAVESATATPTASSFSVSFSWETPSQGDLCLDPLEILVTDDTWTGSWTDFMDSSTLSQDNCCGLADGRDVWFDVWVGGSERLFVDQDSPIPTMLQAVEDCGDDALCSFYGEDELSWYNETSSPAAARIGVEAISSTATSGPIELYFDRAAIPAGDACSTAFDVDETSLPWTDSEDLWQYGPAWPGCWCSVAEGSDIWYAVDVPADQVVFFEEQSSANTVVYLATDCPATSCVSSADEPEQVNWYNNTSDTVTVYAVAKARYAIDNAANLSVSVDVGPANIGDFCTNPIDLTSETMPYEWGSGNLSDYTNGFTGLAANGCAEVTGPEVWFEVFVPDGHWLHVTNSSTTPVAIQVLDSCSTNTCQASGGASLFWQNDLGADANLFVAVEGAGAWAGALFLTFDVIDAPPTMFGPDSFGYWGATDDDISMCPDISTTGTELMLMWSCELVDMDMSFEFYGETYTQTWVAWDGVISFEEANYYSGGYYPIPTGDSFIGMPFIAPYWASIEGDEEPGGIYYEAYTMGSQNYFAVQWNVPPWWSMPEYDIRMVLEESTGMIHVCYVNTDVGEDYYSDGMNAASGIQQNATSGLQYSLAEPVLTNGLHLWFVPPS